eukprot:gene14173-10124_t
MLSVLTAQEFKQTNLLMIMFDDLRPELSIYGRDYMITPNFERLAAKSVVFDYAFCQVAVCNPSRDSLMTGLRPDTVGTYNFGHSWPPHISFPTQLVRSGYNTAGIGKIFHWESTDRNIWSFDAWDNHWYDYQGAETAHMNASIMPDKVLPEEKFRDSLFVDRALSTWSKMVKEPKPFMLAVGFKLPHLAIHVPYKYYEMYKGKSAAWRLTKRELRFPYSSPEISYRCCADFNFQYLREEGRLRFNRTAPLGDINGHFPEDAHEELMHGYIAELMHGYIAGITYLDTQLGRLLDFMDQNQLWETTTVVLSADHGMHNGEKNIWEKWTLFEESTRVPLLISHPLSPFKGQHYPYPVELVDVYATLNEILKVPVTRERACGNQKCKPLSGKSLAPVVLGKQLYEEHFGAEKFGILYRLQNLISQAGGTIMGKRNKHHNQYSLPSDHAIATAVGSPGGGSVVPAEMPILEHNFALSQVIRCAPKQQVLQAIKARSEANGKDRIQRSHFWNDCDINRKGKGTENEVIVLGYAMRTPDFRYIVYFHFNRSTELPMLNLPPFVEELYDHRNETLKEFTHRETFNLAVRPAYQLTIQALRNKLIAFIRSNILFGDH